MYNLAGGDILKVDAVTKVLLTEVLTMLSYEQDVEVSSKNKY